MGKLSPLPARKIIKKLEQAGFLFVRQRGSHISMKNSEGVIVVVPDHGVHDIAVGTMHAIIVKQAGLTIEQFNKL